MKIEKTNLVIILCRPQLGENIGAVARCMKNLSINDLRIVNPTEGWSMQKAIELSSGGRSILESSCTSFYENLQDALLDIHKVFAITARQRKMVFPVLLPEEVAVKAYADNRLGKKTALIFGCESSGLSTEEIEYADFISIIPANNNYSSFNLSNAVLIYCYEYSKIYYSDKNNKHIAHMVDRKKEIEEKNSPIINKEEFFILQDLVQKTIKLLPFNDKDKKKYIRYCVDTIKRSKLSFHEWGFIKSILRSILNLIQR